VACGRGPVPLPRPPRLCSPGKPRCGRVAVAGRAGGRRIRSRSLSLLPPSPFSPLQQPAPARAGGRRDPASRWRPRIYRRPAAQRYIFFFYRREEGWWRGGGVLLRRRATLAAARGGIMGTGGGRRPPIGAVRCGCRRG
jgi:hypothetical protein